MTHAGEPLIKIHLLELPVPLAAKAQQHVDELLREFHLMAARPHDSDTHRVPHRLLELVDVLTRQFGGINERADERLAEAIDSGVPVIDDHVLAVPAAGGPASRALADMLDEADEYCRDGKELLTLTTPQGCVTYRNWYLEQVIDQLNGATPVSWPDYQSGHRH